MRRIFLFAIIFIILFAFDARAEEISLTAEEAVAIALRDNRDVLLKAEDVKEAKLKIREADSGLFPTLDVTATKSDTRGYYAKDVTQTTTQTTLKQYLYKGGKTINTIKQKGHDLEVAQAILDKTNLETIASVQKALYTLLLAEESLELNKGIVDNISEHLDFIKKRYNSGQASESDILNTEASLSAVEQAYEASLNQVESSRALLNNLLYLDKGVAVKPNALFSYDVREVAFDQALLDAMKNRPEIRQYEEQAAADKNAIEIAKAAGRPSIYASWDYYSRDRVLASTTKGWNDYNIIGITFSWPVFDGWKTKAKLEQAIVDLKQTQILKQKSVSNIALELKNAYVALKDAIVKIGATESDIKLYRDNLESVNTKYSQGITSSLDLNDANLKYEVALFNKNQAIYDYISAKIDFDKATGGL